MHTPLPVTLGFCCVCVLLNAQSDANKGQIVGTVYDPNRAVIPKTSVKIRNLDAGFVRELTTNEAGQYRAIALDPGRYEVVVDSPGFSPTTVSGLVLNVGSTVSADVTLQVQAATTAIEIGETLVSVSPQASRVVDSRAIHDLPINGRRFQDLALVTPTVQVDPQRGQISIAGQRGINSNVMLDGADYNQPFFGGIRGGERSNAIFTVPQSSILEFQTIPTGYAAEYGRSTGGMVNAVTKSGTNDYHGEAFYQLRHKELGLKTPFNRQSLETQHQSGGAIGGPIKTDRMFFFGAIERQNTRNPRLVFFPRLREIAATPDVAEAYNYLLSQETPFKQTNDGTALDSRVDYTLSGGSRLTFRYNMSRADGLNSTTTGTRIEPTIDRTLNNNGTERDRTHTGNAQYTAILGPQVVNDLRFSVSSEERPRDTNSEMPQVSTTAGLDGAVNFLPTTQDDRRIQINDGISLTHGSHTVKLGFDYNHLSAWQLFGSNQFGAFSVSGSNVRTALDIISIGGNGATANRFDNSAVTYTRQIGNMLVDLSVEQIAAYAQDSWRVSPSFTIDYGIRWEGQWNPQPAANNADLVNQVKGVSFPIGSVDPTTFKSSPAQVMPRVGFAWNPGAGRRTVIRGNTGIFYAATPMLLFTSPLNNFRLPPGDVSILLPRAGSTVYKDLLAIGVDLNQFTLDKLPILTVDQVQRAASGGGAAPDPFRGANLTTMASDYQNPRAFQAGLGGDTEIFRNLVVGAQLYYVNTVHLQRNRDYNLPVPTLRPEDKAQRPFFGLRSGRTRPVSTLGALWVRETGSRSVYRGLTVSSQYRTGRFQFGAFYTASEAFSADDNERDATGFRMDNSFNLAPEYNYSDFDMRHQFAGYGVVSLPLGIELSSTMRFTTGRPIDPRTGADTNEDLASNDRAYEAAGVSFKRNSFRNRGFRDLDLRFLKTFPIRERLKVQFSTEMFNIFNFSNVVYAGNDLNYGLGVDPATGATLAPQSSFRRLRLADGSYDPVNTQLGNPFQAQFGLRLLF